MALIVFTVGSGGVALCHFGAQRLSQANRETDQAVGAALSAVDQVRSVPFAEAFVRFNATTGDDLAGSCPGNAFEVPGLEAVPGDADGLAGEILFPGNGIALLENGADPQLGMPRDLSGDEATDAADHKADYVVLPMLVRVEWQGASGPRRVEIVTTLAREKAP